jgi:adenosine 3'-phospho 5'-phosphosulfate transporter B2
MLMHGGGILMSLIVYGILQERIMTQPYGEGIYFKDYSSSAYLVLNNRIISMFVAIIIMKFKGESLKNQAPILACSGVSVSNTIATFCQYDALRYVSFPTQTLGKCGKMIPVMVMGILISGKKYSWKDFLIAAFVTVGCVVFVQTGDIGNENDSKSDTAFGLLLMAGYLFSDGFTSVLQERLFKGYEMSTYNQMLYVNLCSGAISLITLVLSNELIKSVLFTLTYPKFFFNSLVLSTAATCGQLVILWTIKEFGALFFATVMTVRQVISIILSCIIYGHFLTAGQWFSAVIVFGALYYKDTMMRKPHGHHPPKPVEEPKLSDIVTEKEEKVGQ